MIESCEPMLRRCEGFRRKLPKPRTSIERGLSLVEAAVCNPQHTSNFQHRFQASSTNYHNSKFGQRCSAMGQMLRYLWSGIHPRFPFRRHPLIAGALQILTLRIARCFDACVHLREATQDKPLESLRRCIYCVCNRSMVTCRK